MRSYIPCVRHTSLLAQSIWRLYNTHQENPLFEGQRMHALSLEKDTFYFPSLNCQSDKES